MSDRNINESNINQQHIKQQYAQQQAEIMVKTKYMTLNYSNDNDVIYIINHNNFVYLFSQNYKLSPEEERVLKECKTESFYYRCMPFSLSFGATVYWAVKNGYLKVCTIKYNQFVINFLNLLINCIPFFFVQIQPSVSYGPWPKVIAFGLFGFVAGRVSYMGECKKKIMALPNSRLAELLHRRDAERSGNNYY